MVGDSIVDRAGKTMLQLNGGGLVSWFGKSGAHSEGLLERITRLLYRNAAPSTIILHIGTNDILESQSWEIRNRIKEILKGVRNLLPNTRIIWSDILIRIGYSRERNEGAGKKTTRNINKYAHKICREDITNSHVITHSSIFNRQNRNVQTPIFEYDCVHPTDAGLALFRQTLSNALVFFNDQPTAFSFPPGAADV